MKKSKIALILFFVVALAGFSFEGGGLFKTGLGFDINKRPNYTGVNFKNSEGLSLWAKQSLDKEGLYNFGIQGSYLFKASKRIAPKNNWSANIQNILDIDLLKFSFLIPVKDSGLSISVGRYSLADVTGLILNQNLDGIYISYESYKKMNFSTHFSIAYTGLLNAYTTPMNAKVSYSSNKVYKLAANCIALTGFFNIPVSKYQHSISLDLNSFIDIKNSGRTKTYLTALANGPIYSNLYFILSATGKLESGGSSKLRGGFALNADLAYYFYKKTSKVGFKTQWFSGGTNSFNSFTVTNTSKVKFKPVRNLWKTALYFGIKPIEDLSLNTELALMCSGKKSGSASLYKGLEWNFSANYVLLSDIYIGFDGGVFIDRNKNVDTSLKLKAMLSF